ALVLDQRVALRVGPEIDALAQVVHLVQVLAPLAVEHGEDDLALELTHDLFADLVLATVVRRLNVLAQPLDDPLTGHLGAASGLGLQLLEGDTHRVELTQRGAQSLEVPGLDLVSRRAVDVAADDVVDEGTDLLLEVLALQDPATFGIDDL